MSVGRITGDRRSRGKAQCDGLVEDDKNQLFPEMPG